MLMLAQLEKKYGGKQYIKREKISEYDRRDPKQVLKMLHVGGDRMSEQDHNYGNVYEKEVVQRFMNYPEITLVEIGILQGTGLAIWCDVFPKADVYGLDFNLEYFERNLQNLKDSGAFNENYPKNIVFDQYADNNKLLANVFKDKIKGINVVIDDACHEDETIIRSLQQLEPYLADDFVYIIEDNASVVHKLYSIFPQYSIHPHGQLTVVRPSKHTVSTKNNSKRLIFSSVFGMTSVFPEIQHHDWDKVIITDKETSKHLKAHSCWNIIIVNKPHKYNSISNRAYKWLSHKYFPQYDYVMYFDSKVILNMNFNANDYIHQLQSSNKLAIFYNHPNRNCIYDEIPVVYQVGQDTLNSAKNCYDILTKFKFPKNIGLTENNIFFRDNTNDKLNKVLEEIYSLLHNDVVRRDQLVFIFCLWKYDLLNSIIFKPNNEKKEIYKQQHITSYKNI
jgi:hypothetical protein